MTNKNKIVLFDFDGVITDTFDFCYDIAKTHLSNLSESEYRSYFEGNINDSKKVSNEKSDDFDFFALYTPQLLNQKPIDGITDIIKQLVEEYTLIIISSTESESIRAFLKKHNLLDLFAEILGNDVETSKVKKIEMVLDKYNITNNDCILITDTLGDLREANRINVKSIAVTWGYHDIPTLEKGIPYVFAKTPQEILVNVKKYFINL